MVTRLKQLSGVVILLWAGLSLTSTGAWAVEEVPPRTSTPTEWAHWVNARLLVGCDFEPRNGAVQLEPAIGVVLDLISSADFGPIGLGPVLEARTVGFREWDADLGVTLYVRLGFHGAVGLGVTTGLGAEGFGVPTTGYGFGKVSMTVQGGVDSGLNYQLKSGVFVRLQSSVGGPEQISVTAGIELGGGFLPLIFALWWGGPHG